jgi:phosphoserine aminotransferase
MAGAVVVFLQRLSDNAVLRITQAQAELVDFAGTGMSVMELSHRSKEFLAVIQTAEKDIRDLMGIPDDYAVMFLQGGATAHFAAIAMNFAVCASRLCQNAQQ